jgi:hypothetical protein
MRSTPLRILAGLAVLVAVIGIILVVLVSYTDLGRRPWQPLGIVLVGAGAVGLLILTVAQAIRTEDREARPPRRSGRRRR